MEQNEDRYSRNAAKPLTDLVGGFAVAGRRLTGNPIIAGAHLARSDYNRDNNSSRKVMGMAWLILAIILILAFALVATIRIGQSQSNREENPRYSQQTGRNWLRLGGMYAIGVLAVVLVLVLFI